MSKAMDDLKYLLDRRIEDATAAQTDKDLVNAITDISKIGQTVERLEVAESKMKDLNERGNLERSKLDLEREKFDAQKKSDNEKREIDLEKLTIDQERLALDKENSKFDQELSLERLQMEKKKLDAEVEKLIADQKLEREKLDLEREKFEHSKELERFRSEMEFKLRKREIDSNLVSVIVDALAKIAISAIGLMCIGGILDMEKDGVVTSKALSSAMSFWSRKV